MEGESSYFCPYPAIVRLSQPSLEVEALVDLNVFMLLFLMPRPLSHIRSLHCLLPTPLTERQIVGLDIMSLAFTCLPLRDEETEESIPKPASLSGTELGFDLV